MMVMVLLVMLTLRWVVDGGDGDSEQVVYALDGAGGDGYPEVEGNYVGDLMQLL